MVAAEPILKGGQRSSGLVVVRKEMVLNKQKQQGHIKGQKQYENRVKQNKLTSSFNSEDEAYQAAEILFLDRQFD